MRIPTVALIALLPVMLAQAQEKRDSTDPIQYKVEFRIQDSADTGAKSSRRYSMLIDANSKGTFRVGNRVPYATATSQAGPNGPGATQYQYADVGVNIDARLRDVGGRVGLSADLEISALVQRPAGATAATNPTISSLRVAVNAVLSSGKPVLVASVDDPITMRKFDIEAAITKAD